MGITIEQLGRAAYAPTYAAMQAYTAARTEASPDVIWLCEHDAVYTQGLAGKSDHVGNPGAIAVVATNRGGQVTYHGPGQVVAYPLIDLKRAGYFIKEYVYRIEEAVIRTLAHFNVTGHRVEGAPGIYVRLEDPGSHALLPQRPQRKPPAPGTPPPAAAGAESQVKVTPDFAGLGKIAALGIKVSRNCTYHGVALNVAMDLEPYARINPCGYAGLRSVDLSTIGVRASWQDVADLFGQKLVAYLAPRN
ncbi:MAG: lipoyl(octanoyl) transferase LipB [Rhodoferax sp.]|nr:lipoyl(octanoyl) transferase LipB [Rhodoferax sp.]